MLKPRQTGPVSETSLITFRFRHPAAALDWPRPLFSGSLRYHHWHRHGYGRAVAVHSDLPGAKE
ncbi:hypothetical protein DSCA_21920 [Desulfosarcina alkanivorans]|uniref:Uncharacterized protein n=1 Tax=Desulfosarcina alkanivorans TaxID=571177 RepID=A0A5K7YFG7_9BACT|nr:hypothetical protein DSCA_21920 [Desulfosarcina alkanivorans]